MRHRISSALIVAGTCLLLAQILVSFAALDAITALTCASAVVCCARMASRCVTTVSRVYVAHSQGVTDAEVGACGTLGQVEPSVTDAEEVDFL